MADNISVKDAAGATVTVRSVDTAGVHEPIHRLGAGVAEVGRFTLQINEVDVSDSVPVPVSDAGGTLTVDGTAFRLVQPTMGTQTNGAYAANDFVDGLLTLSNAVPVAASGGIIQLVSVYSKSTQTGAYDVIFFHANPSSTTVANNGAVQVNAADATKLIGVAHCDDVTSFGTGSLHQALGQPLPFKIASGTTIYAAVVCRFALTQTSTSDMILSALVLPT